MNKDFDDWLNQPASGDHFILGGEDGHQLIPVNAAIWAIWFETSMPDRIVARTYIDSDCYVSTVFLGLDHSWGHGPKLLFETMVFQNGHSTDMDRYSTWTEAEAGHEAIVKHHLGVPS